MPKIDFKNLPYPIEKNYNIFAPATLEKNTKLNKFINKDTVGALNNYAEHENVRIFFKPLENDLFDDIGVSVFKNMNNKGFAMKVPENDKHGNFGDFMRELYTNVANTVKDLKNNK